MCDDWSVIRFTQKTEHEFVSCDCVCLVALSSLGSCAKWSSGCGSGNVHYAGGISSGARQTRNHRGDAGNGNDGEAFPGFTRCSILEKRRQAPANCDGCHAGNFLCSLFRRWHRHPRFCDALSLRRGFYFRREIFAAQMDSHDCSAASPGISGNFRGTPRHRRSLSVAQKQGYFSAVAWLHFAGWPRVVFYFPTIWLVLSLAPAFSVTHHRTNHYCTSHRDNSCCR